MKALRRPNTLTTIREKLVFPNAEGDKNEMFKYSHCFTI